MNADVVLGTSNSDVMAPQTMMSVNSDTKSFVTSSPEVGTVRQLIPAHQATEDVVAAETIFLHCAELEAVEPL